MRPFCRSALFAAGIVAALVLLTACGNGGSISVHGDVVKTVGRSCNLLSAAFPSVAHRTVTFVDQTGVDIGRVVTGAQRAQDNDRGGCELSSAFRLSLPMRATYAANVSSQVTQIATSAAVDADALAAKGWRFDVRIPATA